MESLVLKVKKYYTGEIFAISFILAICDVFFYKIIRTNLSFVVFKDSLDFIPSFLYLFSSFKVKEIFVFILSFALRYFITTKLLKTVSSKDVVLITLFSIVFVTANSYEQMNSSSLFLASGTLVFIAILFFVLLFIFCLNIILLIKVIIPFICQWNPRFPPFFDKHLFLYSFSFILISWSPFIVIRYPAGIEWDAYHQLMMYMGDWKLSQNWPIVSTYFFGILFDIGKFLFNSNNNGVFFTVIVQSAICSCCFAYSILVQRKLSVANGWIILCLFSYSLLTVFPRYFTSIVKDALFSSLMVLYISSLAFLMFYKEEMTRYQRIRKYFFLLGTSFGVCTLRHTGVYIILFCLFFTSFCFVRYKDKLFLRLSSIFVVSLTIFISFSFLLSSHVGKNPLSPKVMYCVPLQQTARFIVNNESRVSDDEIEVINRIIHYNNVVKSYNPKLCDPMMGMFHADTINDQIDYLKKVWWSQFVKSPLTYFAATYNQNEGFFFPLAKQAGGTIHLYTRSNHNDAEHSPYFSEVSSLLKTKGNLFKYVVKFENFFIFFIFCNCALNVWLIIAFTFFFKKKAENFLLILPLFIIVLTLVAGPTFYWNGERYALPIISCNLFLISLFCSQFYSVNVKNDSLDYSS